MSRKASPATVEGFEDSLDAADAAYDKSVQETLDAPQRESADEYLKGDPKNPSLRSGLAHLLVTKSALHCWHESSELNPHYQQAESAEFDYGRAAHSVLLEGKESSLHVIEADDWRKKDAKDARDAARSAGKTPLLARQMVRVRTMVKAAQAYVAASELAGVFDNGEPEHSIKWQEGPTLCRSRLDWLSGDRKLVLDYKTAANANPGAFVNVAVGMGYTMQEAFYRRGVKAVYGREPRFVFLLQEKEPPYACSLVAFDPAMQEMGDRQVQYALGLWGAAMASGKWRGYPSRVAHLEPPAWYAARAEEWATSEQLEDMAQP